MGLVDGENRGRRVRAIGMIKNMNDKYHREIVSGWAIEYRIRRAKPNKRVTLAMMAKRREKALSVISLMR